MDSSFDKTEISLLKKIILKLDAEQSKYLKLANESATKKQVLISQLYEAEVNNTSNNSYVNNVFEPKPLEDRKFVGEIEQLDITSTSNLLQNDFSTAQISLPHIPIRVVGRSTIEQTADLIYAYYVQTARSSVAAHAEVRLCSTRCETARSCWFPTKSDCRGRAD